MKILSVWLSNTNDNILKNVGNQTNDLHCMDKKKQKKTLS